jgi:hypothetical protein
MTGQSTEPRSGPPRSMVLDPEQPAETAAAVAPEGTVVLLLSSAEYREWAARSAVELSAAWAERGRRVVLADLHLETPMLYAGVEASEMEGVVDIFLYGASLSRMARPVRGGAFYLIPAGTYAPDPAEIYRHSRWRKLVAGFRETDAALLLFVPAESADLGGLSMWASEAILLGPDRGANVAARLAASGIRLLAVLEPPPGTVAAPEDEPAVDREPGAYAPATGASGAADRDGEEPVSDPWLETGAGAEAPVERSTLAPPPDHGADPELELPPPPVRRRATRRGPSILLWLLFALVVLATVGYLVAMLRPDLIRQFLPDAAAPAYAPPVVVDPPPAGVTALGEVLPYSIQVRAFTTLAAAIEEMSVEQRRIPGVPFFISPEEIQGILYYKIMAGLAADTVGATRLRDRLVQAGVIEASDGPGAWNLRQYTPLAYDLGEFPTQTEAVLRADSLLTQQIPTYTAMVPYSDGSRRWRLYAGAYRDSTSADPLREALLAAGVQARLTARAGLAAPATE